MLRTRAVEKVVFAGGGAKEEGEVEARYEEMEMEYIWDSHSEETDEETEFRIKVSWKSCVLDASGSVYCPLITIPGHRFQVVFQGLQGTFSSIHSVLRAPYEGVCDPKMCFQFLVFASTPATPAPLFSLPLYSTKPPSESQVRFSRLGKTLLAVERVLYPVAYPLRLPAKTLLAHGLWIVAPSDDRSPAREFYLAKAKTMTVET